MTETKAPDHLDRLHKTDLIALVQQAREERDEARSEELRNHHRAVDHFEEAIAARARSDSLQAEVTRLRAALHGADGLLMSAAENLRSADRDERRVEAAFRIAGKLDQLRAALSPTEPEQPQDRMEAAARAMAAADTAKPWDQMSEADRHEYFAMLRAALADLSPTEPAREKPEPKIVKRLLEDSATYIDTLHRRYKVDPFKVGIDTEKLRACAAALSPTEPEGKTPTPSSVYTTSRKHDPLLAAETVVIRESGGMKYAVVTDEPSPTEPEKSHGN